MDEAAIESLIARFAAGDTTPDEERQIRAYVDGAPDAASRVSRQLLLHRMLGQLGRPRTDAARLVASLPGESVSAKVMPSIARLDPARRRRRWPAAVAVATAMAAAAGAVLWLRGPGADGQPGVAESRDGVFSPARRLIGGRPAAAPAAVMESVSGEVFLVERGQRRAATATELIPDGAGLVAVTAFSSATVRFPDSTRLVLSGGGVLGAVSAGSPPSTVERAGKHVFLAQGRLSASVPPQPADRPAVFTTPHAEIIVLGTRLRLDVSPEGTRISVDEGRVRVRGGGGQPPAEIESQRFALVRAGAAPMVGEEAQRGAILFVVANPPDLFGGDEVVIERLRAMGFEVRTISSSAPSLADEARSSRLVAISSTVTSQDVSAPLRELPVPVVVWEPYLLDDLGMTRPCDEGDCGEEQGPHPAIMKEQTHPLAAGLSGTVSIAKIGSGATSWGIPGLQAHWIATLAGNPHKAVIFAYETGTPMAVGAAPARRVALFLNHDTPKFMTDAGWRLFEAAISWAAEPAPKR